MGRTRGKSRLAPLDALEAKLKLARSMIENVLWNLKQHPDDPQLRDVAGWQRVFEDLLNALK